MRIASQLHDETVFEVKTGASGQAGADAAIKQLLAYASLFEHSLKGGLDPVSAARVNYGGAQHPPSVMKSMLEHAMGHAEKAWSRAMQDVMGVTCSFYIMAKVGERRAIEQRFVEMAKRSPRKGHKAAVARKVMVARVKYMLEDEAPQFTGRGALQSTGRMVRQGSVTGRMSGGPMIMNSIPKIDGVRAGIIGKKADRFIVDELTQYRKP